MPVILSDNLVKQYGRIQALKGVSLAVERGEIFGLLGQNGAGKTTMVKILLRVLGATDGHASLLGEPAGTVAVRRRVGYPPEDHRPWKQSSPGSMTAPGAHAGGSVTSTPRRAADQGHP